MSTAVQWATIAGGVVALALILRFSYRVWHKISAILEQVTPNGGNSEALGDQVLQMRGELRDHTRQDNENLNLVLEQLAEMKRPPTRAKRVVK